MLMISALKIIRLKITKFLSAMSFQNQPPDAIAAIIKAGEKPMFLNNSDTTKNRTLDFALSI